MSSYIFSQGVAGEYVDAGKIEFRHEDSKTDSYLVCDYRRLKITLKSDQSESLILIPVLHLHTNGTTTGTISCDPQLYCARTSEFDTINMEGWKTHLSADLSASSPAQHCTDILRKCARGQFVGSAECANWWHDTVWRAIQAAAGVRYQLVGQTSSPNQLLLSRTHFEEEYDCTDPQHLVYCLTDPAVTHRLVLQTSDGDQQVSVDSHLLLAVIGCTKFCDDTCPGKSLHICIGNYFRPAWLSEEARRLFLERMDDIGNDWTSRAGEIRNGDFFTVYSGLVEAKKHLADLTMANGVASSPGIQVDSSIQPSRAGTAGMSSPTAELMAPAQYSGTAVFELPGASSESRRAELEGTPAHTTVGTTCTHRGEVFEIGEGGDREPEVDVDPKKRTCGCKCM